MDIGTALVAIAGIGAFYSLRAHRIRVGDLGRGFGSRRAGPAANMPDPALPSPREQELQKEVGDLRERIKVLERIATDGRQTSNLAAEIESLRDR